MDNIHKPQRRKFYFDKHKMIGAYVPNRVADVLSLLSCSLQKSKTSVIREALEMYYQSHDLNEEQMIKKVAEDIISEWVYRSEKNEGEKKWEPGRRQFRWEDFKKEIKHNLESAKIPQYYITQIFRYIDQSQF